MSIAPQIRIIVRYLVGLALGYIVTRYSLGAYVGDTTIIVDAITTIVIGLATELWYARAKKNGGAT